MNGKSLGPYELVRLLGRGGMGEVYLARDPRLGREVALKVLPSDLGSSPQRRERFLREARSVSALNHPNITTIHEIGEADNRDYIAFEHVEGRTLEAILREGGGFPLERLLDLALPIAEALQYAHGKGIVHRDLKPANVMVSELGIPKILDFGLAKTISAASKSSEALTAAKLTEDGVVLGTVAYMSPEQALGREVDARSDIFSFGSLLYEVATAKPSFSGATSTEVLNAVVNHEPTLLDRVRPELPEELGRIVEKAHRKDPAERYQSMAELVVDLRHIKKTSGSGAVEPHVPEPRKMGRLAVLAAVGLAALVVAIVAYRALTPEPASPEADSLAVMYFENLSDPADSDNLGRMLTSLLTTELSRSEGLEVVSSQRLYDIAKSLGQKEEGMVQRSVATQVAERAGVGTMIVGQITKAGERLVATTELVNVDDGRVLGSTKAEGRSVEEIFTVAETLGQQVRQTLQRPTRASDESLASQLTDSVEAYRAYVRGESFLQRLETPEAIAAFQEAVRIDPEFALAYYRLAVALGWYGSGGSSEAIDQALRYVDKLPPAYQDVVRAWTADSTEEAVRLLEAALVEDRHNKAALQELSDFYIHDSQYLDVARSVALMEELLALDPDFSLVYEHLALGHVFLGQTERAWEWLHIWEPKDLDPVREARAFLLAQEKSVEEALRVASKARGPVSSFRIGLTAILASRWDVTREIVSQEPPEVFHNFHFRLQGLYYAYRGAFEWAEVAFREVDAGSEGPCYDVGCGADAHFLHSLAQLMHLKEDAGSAQLEAKRALAIQPECPRCLYFAGLFALMNDKRPEAKKHLETLNVVDTRGRNVVSDLYLDALQGEMVLDDGNAEGARELFEPVVSSGRLLWDGYTGVSSTGAAFRDGLARTYIALGEKEKAVEALEALLESGFERIVHPVLYVRALYTLGVLYGELGDESKSRDYFERFLEHWGNADWDLAEVRDARARLQS